MEAGITYFFKNGLIGFKLGIRELSDYVGILIVYINIKRRKYAPIKTKFQKGLSARIRR